MAIFSTFIIPSCGKLWKSRRDVERHRRSKKAYLLNCSQYTGKAYTTVKVECRQCPTCNKKFSRKSSLTRHLLTSTACMETKLISNPALHTCPFCPNWVTSRRYRLAEHIEGYHFGKIVCHVCGSRFSRRSNLKYHQEHPPPTCRSSPAGPHDPFSFNEWCHPNFYRISTERQRLDWQLIASCKSRWQSQPKADGQQHGKF